VDRNHRETAVTIFEGGRLGHVRFESQEARGSGTRGSLRVAASRGVRRPRVGGRIKFSREPGSFWRHRLSVPGRHGLRCASTSLISARCFRASESILRSGSPLVPWQQIGEVVRVRRVGVFGPGFTIRLAKGLGSGLCRRRSPDGPLALPLPRGIPKLHGFEDLLDDGVLSGRGDGGDDAHRFPAAEAQAGVDVPDPGQKPRPVSPPDPHELALLAIEDGDRWWRSGWRRRGSGRRAGGRGALLDERFDGFRLRGWLFHRRVLDPKQSPCNAKKSPCNTKQSP